MPGKVIVQTYNPDNFAIQCASKQNYEEFYETEIALREQLKYPPFCDIIVIGFNGINEKEIQEISLKMYKELQVKLEEFKIFKPMPAPIDKIQNRYRYRIIIKGNMTEKANKELNSILKQAYNENLKTTRISIDINPNNMS
ncbi:MAG: hypothetical protein V8R81_05380 [Clostridia bacterium]